MMRIVDSLPSICVVFLCGLQSFAAGDDAARTSVVPGRPHHLPEAAPAHAPPTPSLTDPTLAMLFEMLQSRSPKTRARALEGLMFFTSSETAQACIDLLSDEDGRVRETACRTLAALNPEDCARPILKALCGENPDVQSAVDAVLPKLRDSLQDTMMALLDSEEEPVMNRLAAAYALGRMGSTAAVDVLSKHAWSDPVELAVFSAAALARLGGPSTEEILVALCGHGAAEVQVQAVRGLAGIGGPHALGVFTEILEDSQVDAAVRAEAAYLLGHVGADVSAMVNSVLEALIQGLRASGVVRAASGDALRRLTGLEFEDHPSPWQDWLTDWQSEHAQEALPPPLVPHAPPTATKPKDDGNLSGLRILFPSKRAPQREEEKAPFIPQPHTGDASHTGDVD